MAIDGTYEVEVDTPLGVQSVKLTLKTDGDSLSGSVESRMGSTEFSGGRVNGNEITCRMKTDSPLGELDLEYKGKITGDDITGEVNTGIFGGMPLKGKRV